MKSLLKVIFSKRSIFVLSTILLGILAISGFLFSSNEYATWTKHPFTAGIVTGLITLAISFFILEEWRQEHTNQLWNEVAKVAYKDVSRLCREIVGTIQLLYVCTQQLPSDFDTKNLDPWGLELPKKASETNRNVSVPVLLEDHPVMIENHHRHLSFDRCEQLCGDEHWRAWSLKQVDVLWTAHCDLVGKWAPLMMQSSQSREFLNEFAKLDHNFRRIYFGFLDYKKGNEKRLWAELNLIDLQARTLYNSLREAASPDYVDRPDLFKLCSNEGLKLKKQLEKLNFVDDLPNYCSILV